LLLRAEYVAWIRETRNANTVLMGRDPLGRSVRKWEDNTKWKQSV
jgi:hypothetical protein